MKPYEGFPQGVRLTPTPDPLFNRLLAEIDDFAEFKLILRALWLLSRQPGSPKMIYEDELCSDPTLLAGVQAFSQNPQAALQAALRRAVDHGILLSSPGPESRRLCLLNTPGNRREVRRGAAARAPTTSDPLGRDRNPRQPGWQPPDPQPSASRPNIFALYEDNIGTIGPQLSLLLQEAEAAYPESWIADAFDIAIQENKRSWSYIAAILRRWGAHGRYADAKPEEKHNGESGRHPPPHRQSRPGPGRRTR